MNKTYKLALLAALGLASVTAAKAQYNDGDLLIGFATSTTDYVIDLGQVPSSANTLLGTIDLSTAFGSTPLTAGISVGIIGSDPDGVINPSGAQTVWTSTLRTGNAPTSGTAGTESKPQSVSSATVENSSLIPVGTAQGQTGVSDGGAAWSEEIAASSTANGTDHSNWGANLGNPTKALTSSPLTLDIWSTTDANSVNAFTYTGDAQITLNGSTATVVWDPVAAVPEPSTYGLFAGAGMLLVGLRRQFSRKA